MAVSSRPSSGLGGKGETPSGSRAGRTGECNGFKGRGLERGPTWPARESQPTPWSRRIAVIAGKARGGPAFRLACGHRRGFGRRRGPSPKGVERRQEDCEATPWSRPPAAGPLRTSLSPSLEHGKQVRPVTLDLPELLRGREGPNPVTLGVEA